MITRIVACVAMAAALLPVFGAETKVDFKQRERIAFVGNGLGVRMSLYGHFETLLHTRFPQKELVVRNFCWPADEVGRQQRPNDYTKLDDPLEVFGADTFICFFGYNESFAGESGIAEFKTNYEKFIDATAKKYGKDGKARFILVSPIAFESAGDPLLPDGSREKNNLKAYTAATAEVAKKLNLPFADIFAPTQTEFARQPGLQYTVAGFQVNEAGDRVVGEALDRVLFGSPNPVRATSDLFGKARAAVADKSWVHEQDYRMLNGWYVYGSRRAPYDVDTFPEEYKKIRAMVAVRDQFVWDLVQGKATSAGPDDSKTGELTVPKTAFGTKKYSEPSELRYLTPDESLAAMTPAPGYKVNTFASEADFPELAKPVQLDFDNKGRLWVACMPTYPQWKPGDARPSDRLLIFEDTNNDGRADKVKVFYDQLHCATSFEFWNGGVLVMSQPRILFLKDTDGDDKADLVVHLLDGIATDDTHHRGGFEWSNGGLLHMNEGVSMSTTIETPWGPMRNKNTPGAYVIDPRSLQIRHFVTPGYGNPWCYVFDNWGVGIVGDGTTAQQHWDSPLSTSQKASRRGLNPVFNTEGMRPVIGSEFIYSRHFPDDVQGQFLYACVINMNGIPRFAINEQGAGLGGKRIEDLLRSTDKNFRPADPHIGPDGALWFGDWHNPLIGHMQYSQRDPNRDKTRGRIYRLTHASRPLNKPVTQYGKSVPELLDQLKAYERRTRYAARRELFARPKAEVTKGVEQWVAKLDKSHPQYAHQLTEALWVLQGQRAVSPALLETVLKSSEPRARAAAVRVLADEWNRIPRAFDYVKPATRDENLRVRLEAVRALSYVETQESADLIIAAAEQPMDYYLEYTVEHALRALEPQWKERFQKEQIAVQSREARDLIATVAAGRPELAAAQRSFRRLGHSTDLSRKDRDEAVNVIASARGNASAGREVFTRACTSCHKLEVREEETLGPNLGDVGKRLKKQEIVESILYPNEKVDPKYRITNVTTTDGEEYSGIAISEDDTTLVLKLGADITQKIPKNQIGRRVTTEVSNMPEIGESLSAFEFVDLVEFLASQKQ
jgi:putative heme-binding domain-containing protein